MTNPTVLIIGGGKFIGRHLVARLLSEKYKVTMLTRGVTPHPFEGLVEWLKCDRDDGPEFDALLHRRAFDYVIDVINFNARQASHVVEFFFGRTTRYIHISSAAVYLLNRMRVNPLVETDTPSDIGESPPMPGSMVEYGWHKRAAELEIEKAVVEKGFPAVILRPAVVSGKYDYTQRDLGYIMRVKDGGPILLPVERCGSHRHCDVSDLVDAVMLCLERKEATGNIYNITSHSILSMPQYLGLIARALDVKLEIMFVPYERLCNELGRGFSPFAYEMDFIQDIHRARCELGFRPARSDEWLGELARYCIEEIKSEPPDEYTQRREKELALAGDVKGNSP